MLQKLEDGLWSLEEDQMSLRKADGIMELEESKDVQRARRKVTRACRRQMKARGDQMISKQLKIGWTMSQLGS